MGEDVNEEVKKTFEGKEVLVTGGLGFVEAGLESQLEEIGIALDRAIPGLALGSVEEDVA